MTRGCPRKIFAEQFTGLARRYQRRGNLLTGLLIKVPLWAAGPGIV